MELDTAPMMHVDNANQKGSRGFVVGEPGWSLFLAFGANGRAPPVKKVRELRVSPPPQASPAHRLPAGSFELAGFQFLPGRSSCGYYFRDGECQHLLKNN